MYMFSENKAEDLEIKKKLLENTISRNIQIVFTDTKSILPNENIVFDSLELTNSICDDSTLRFGGCISSQLTFSTINFKEQLVGREIKVYIKQSYLDNVYPSKDLYPSGELYPCKVVDKSACIFTGTIDSAKRQQNKTIKEVTAYDNFYLAGKINIYTWFFGFATYSPNATIKVLKECVIDMCEEKGLIVDSNFYDSEDDKKLSLSATIVKEVYNGKLTVLNLLQDLCECSAKFAFCDGEGSIKFKKLPQENDVTDVYTVGYYTDLNFEDYTVAKITKARFKYSKDKTYTENIVATSGKQNYYDGDNKFISCNTEKTLVSKFIRPSGAVYGGWMFYEYRPFSVNLFDRWWLEPGDTIQLNTGVEDTPIITSTIFNRTLSGTVGITVQVSTESSEYQGDDDKQWATT